jgi:hypothetical protein
MQVKLSRQRVANEAHTGSAYKHRQARPLRHQNYSVPQGKSTAQPGTTRGVQLLQRRKLRQSECRDEATSKSSKIAAGLRCMTTTLVEDSRRFTRGCRGRRFARRGSAKCCRTALCRRGCCWPRGSRGFDRLELELKRERRRSVSCSMLRTMRVFISGIEPDFQLQSC